MAAEHLSEQAAALVGGVHLETHVDIGPVHGVDQQPLRLAVRSYGTHPAVVAAVEPDLHAQDAGEDTHDVLGLGVERLELGMRRLRGALAVVARDQRDQFDLVVRETRQFAVADDVVRVQVVLAVGDDEADVGQHRCRCEVAARCGGQPVHARGRVEELERELEKARKDLERAERESREREGGEEHPWNPEEAEKELRRLKEELGDLHLAIEEREKKWHKANEVKDDERALELEREMDELREHAKNIEQHIADIKQMFEIQKLEKRVGEEEGAIEELRGKLEKQPDNEELRKKLKAHEEEAEGLRKKLEGLHREFEKRHPEGREDGDPAAELERMIERLRGELEELREHPDRNAEAIRDHERSIKALEEAVANLRKGERGEDPEGELKEAEGHLKELKSAIEALLKEKKAALEKGKEDAARELERAIEEHEVEIRRVRDHVEALKKKFEEHQGDKKDR